MSVIILPRRHPGQRQPAAFVVRLPDITNNARPTIFSGVDPETQAAVMAEIAVFEASIAAAQASAERLAALLQPFKAEGVE